MMGMCNNQFIIQYLLEVDKVELFVVGNFVKQVLFLRVLYQIDFCEEMLIVFQLDLRKLYINECVC